MYWLLALPICGYLLLLNTQRYREADFGLLNAKLDAVSPKLHHIVSSKQTREKLLELKSLISKYPKDYIVAPSLPAAYYIFGNRNPIPADWLTTFEIKGKTVFLENSFIQGEPLLEKNSDKSLFSPMGLFLNHHCKPLEKTKHFTIYSATEIENQLNLSGKKAFPEINE